MIKFLGKDMPEQEAYEEIINKLSLFIESEQVLLDTLNEIRDYCEKKISDGMGTIQGNETIDAIGKTTFVVMKKMFASQRIKEDEKWEKIKQKGKINEFIKDVEKSAKAMQQTIDGISTTIMQANKSCSPSVLKDLVDVYIDMTEWGLEMYKDQLDWAKENVEVVERGE